MSERPGRNDPCPCGSGLKYKRCCLPKVERPSGYTREERESALAKLASFSAVDEEKDRAYEEFTEGVEELDGIDDDTDRSLEGIFDWWFWFDRPLPDGRLVVDVLLAEDATISPGERRFLEMARETVMRAYEVEETRPGLLVSLMDVLDGSRVTVRERTASRTLKRSDLVGLRVIRRGASGEPEIEGGVLAFPYLMRREVLELLSARREELRRQIPRYADEALSREMPVILHALWVSGRANPRVPHLRTTDDEAVVISRVHFAVRDEKRLTAVLDGANELARETGETVWSWSGRTGPAR